MSLKPSFCGLYLSSPMGADQGGGAWDVVFVRTETILSHKSRGGPAEY